MEAGALRLLSPQLCQALASSVTAQVVFDELAVRSGTAFVQPEFTVAVCGEREDVSVDVVLASAGLLNADQRQPSGVRGGGDAGDDVVEAGSGPPAVGVLGQFTRMKAGVFEDDECVGIGELDGCGAEILTDEGEFADSAARRRESTSYGGSFEGRPHLGVHCRVGVRLRGGRRRRIR
ncbi:hypothetical protein B7C42_06045 [Nocardia cerradoensis]|uniref:Uncharacterized protein n=1 Tax=Nocardia cerradoensis TaxID=85688 RepID=A0A231GYJ9_9NOCA|nr:hypothetical protein B7C42_06045 [Nocardia cerradoensis]